MTPQNRRKKAIHLSDYQPTPFAIDHTELRFVLGSEVTDVTAELTMSRRPDAAQDARLKFDGDELVLVS
ncbi:unnamed protein product, partial [Scytosiphon promiscuus]